MTTELEDIQDLGSEDEDDEMDWEEVQVPDQPMPGQQDIEITILTGPKTEKKQRNGQVMTQQERMNRITCHKFHTLALIVNAWTRNLWINDELLHARLMSLTPLPFQEAFSSIHPSRVPEAGMRGRMFEAALNNLAEWWSTKFFEVFESGHIKNRTYDQITHFLTRHGFTPLASNEEDQTIKGETSKKGKGKGKAKATETEQEITEMVEDFQDLLESDKNAEWIKSPKSLMKHALMGCGTRDVSAQLFTALCRSLGIPARLVVSIQSVPWQAGVGKPKTAYKKKPKISANDGDDAAAEGSGSRASTVEEDVVQMSEKAQGKQKAKPVIKLRKQKQQTTPVKTARPPPLQSVSPLVSPPVFWTEVFSRPDARWLCVDPIRGYVNKPKLFDPSATASSAITAENRMVYVLAFEEDGYAKDVTRKYAKDYTTKVAKVQGGSASAGAKGRALWWEHVLSGLVRPYRLHRDDIEDEEMEIAQYMEGMPSSMAGFKDHPLYALERHLKQTEAIYPAPPSTRELGKFRGEPVYPRSSVTPLKTPENWLRSAGRSVRAGVQAVKFIKMRANTVGRMRELEVLKDSGGAEEGPNAVEVMQGLYARDQTEMFVPAPVVDGKIPKNNFGNIDLYVESMLPRGAVHVPFKGTAKIARKLGIDFAEAVTGFEFRKRRATPVLEGIVIAQGNEAMLLEAYIESERIAQEKAQVKKEERVLKRWTRLIHGLKIRARLQKEYAGRKPKDLVKTDEQVQFSNKDFEVLIPTPAPNDQAPGGFVVNADDVVKAYKLPKMNPYMVAEQQSLASTSKISEGEHSLLPMQDEDTAHSFTLETFDLEPDLEPEMVPAVTLVHTTAQTMPKSMRELAEEAQAAALRVAPEEDDGDDEDDGYMEPEPEARQASPNRVAPSRKGKAKAKATPAIKSKSPVKKASRKRKRGSDETDEEEDGEKEVVGDTVKTRRRTNNAPTAAVAQPRRSLRPRRSTARYNQDSGEDE